MANEKFSDFSLETDLTNFEGLVGFQAGVDNLQITPANLGSHLPTRFMLTASSDAPFYGAGGAETYYTWHGGQKGTTASVSFGGYYAPTDFEIISVNMRYESQTANPIQLGVGESAVFSMAKLDTPTAAGSNDGPKTNFVDATSFWSLTSADNGTWPLITYTFASPLSITAGDIILLYSVETGTVTPTSADMGAYFLCQYT